MSNLNNSNSNSNSIISNVIKKVRQVARLNKKPFVKKCIVDKAIINCIKYMYDAKRVDWNYYIKCSPDEFETKRKSLRLNLNELLSQLNIINVNDPEFDKLKDLLTGYRTHIFKALESKNEEELIRLHLFEDDADAMLFHHILAYLSKIE